MRLIRKAFVGLDNDIDMVNMRQLLFSHLLCLFIENQGRLKGVFGFDEKVMDVETGSSN